MLLPSFLALLTLLLTTGSFANVIPSSRLTKRANTVTFDGRTFINHGLVGFGRFSPTAVDSFGETLGGLGSSIALETFQQNKDGTFSGNIRLNPDRGHNTQTTTDYRARTHQFSFSFDPKKGGPTMENIALKYRSTVLYRYGSNFTTGFDPLAVRPGNAVSPALPVAPQDNHVSVDEEGYAISKDGLLAFFSDEYGPYIYVHERRTGFIVATIAPPAAITPMKEAKLNFTSETTPDTGRAGNQGFEGLTLDRNTNTLWALLQSSTIQDSVGGSKTTNRYSRLFGYNVDNPFKPKLISEYVVPLPQSSKKNTRAASELHVVDSTTFLVLARDGNGFGDTSSDSTFKQADLISTKGATNIANTAFDTPSKPVAPNGVLDPSVTPVQYTSFINLIERPQLAKFGLQVGGAFDSTLVAGKLESLAVGPLPDKSGNQLLFVVSDNDFITTKGYQAAEKANGRYVVEPYSDPYAEQYGDASTQIYIYNVTLPGYSQGSSPY